jgi:beta-glucanase (GH16 family)
MAFDLSSFHLSFDDEFNTFTSTPDGSAGWQTTFYFGGRSLPSNGEQEYYSDSTVGANPFSLANGALTITAAPGSNPEGLAYTSGLITTEGMFTQTYGYFEIRAQVPEGQGMWPGFWLLNADKSWPPEIDVLEAFGATNANGEGGADQVHVNAITSDWASGGGGAWVTIPGNIYTGYHTYGTDWEPDYVTYYIDGQEVYQVKTPSDLNQPMYMLANLAVGGPWVGNASGETGQMHIDYIRAYSQAPNVATVALQTISSPDGIDTAPVYGSTPPTGTAGTGSLTVRVAEDQWNGDAQFTVFVDGHQVGGIQTATASHASGQWQDIALTGDFGAGAHSVAINFLNDAWGGTAATDRNLYVQSVTINGETIASTDAVNTAANGYADPGSAAMDIDGTATFTSTGIAPSSGSTGSAIPAGSDMLYLRVAEDAWNGDAKFSVFVDGHQIGDTQTATASHASGQWQDIALTGDFTAGPHTVDINFINDAWGGSAATDRNLYVGAIGLNGETIFGNAAFFNNAANGHPDANSAAMNIAGTVEFKTTGTPTALPTTSTITLHVSEDAWNGDAHFNVLVDGAQVGGTQTATVSHASGQWQDITLTGDFGTTGPGKVDVVFLNDAWGGTAAADRNLYVQSIDVNDHHFAGNAASNNAANGAAAADPGAAVMMINGIVDFSIGHTAPPVDDFWHIA